MGYSLLGQGYSLSIRNKEEIPIRVYQHLLLTTAELQHMVHVQSQIAEIQARKERKKSRAGHHYVGRGLRSSSIKPDEEPGEQ